MKNVKLLVSLRFQLGTNGGNDEAAEGAVELVGSSAEELGIGTAYMLGSGFAVTEVTILPISKAFGVLHFEFALPDGFGKSADGTFAALCKRSGVRVRDSVGVRAAVAGAHDNTVLRGEFATEMVKSK